MPARRLDGRPACRRAPGSSTTCCQRGRKRTISGAWYCVARPRARRACNATARRNESAIRKRYEDLVDEKKPAYLFSGFLLRSAKTSKGDTALAFALEIAIEVPLFEVDRKWWFDEYYEGETLLNETVTLHLRWSGGKATVRYGLRTAVGSGNATKRAALSDPKCTARGASRSRSVSRRAWRTRLVPASAAACW